MNVNQSLVVGHWRDFFESPDRIRVVTQEIAVDITAAKGPGLMKHHRLSKLQTGRGAVIEEVDLAITVDALVTTNLDEDIDRRSHLSMEVMLS